MGLVLCCAMAPARVQAQAPEEPSKSDCLSSFEDAQRLRLEHKLREARGRAEVCSHASCPAVIRSDCGKWVDELGKEIPRVLVNARFHDGSPASGVRILVDGEVRSESGNASALEVNPGPHEVRLEHDDLDPVVQKVTVAAGEEKRLDLRFPAPGQTEGVGDAEAGTSGSATPPAVYAFAGLGALAVGGFAYFGMKGRSKQSDLEDCRPNCSAADAEAMRNDYLFADVFLGVGALSLGFAGWLLMRDGDAKASTSLEAGGTAVDVRAVSGGAVGSVCGTF